MIALMVPPLIGYALAVWFDVTIPWLWYYVPGVSTAIALAAATMITALGLVLTTPADPDQPHNNEAPDA